VETTTIDISQQPQITAPQCEVCSEEFKTDVLVSDYRCSHMTVQCPKCTYYWRPKKAPNTIKKCSACQLWIRRWQQRHDKREEGVFGRPRGWVVYNRV
jgi:uncharacterized Zn finger protein